MDIIDTEDHTTPVNAASVKITPGSEDTLERVVNGKTAGCAPQDSSSGQIQWELDKSGGSHIGFPNGLYIL